VGGTLIEAAASLKSLEPLEKPETRSAQPVADSLRCRPASARLQGCFSSSLLAACEHDDVAEGGRGTVAATPDGSPEGAEHAGRGRCRLNNRQCCKVGRLPLDPAKRHMSPPTWTPMTPSPR
jgi:hypothetical protein